MAYFANGSEGALFEAECAGCVLGEEACPIAWVQTEYNYETVDYEVVSAILACLVKQDGRCSMKRLFPHIFFKGGGTEW